jgi:predicted kinase
MTQPTDWSDMDQVRAEHERTGLNRTNEPPAGKPVSEMTSAEYHAAHYRATQEHAASTEKEQ